jgi:hypothetical protein
MISRRASADIDCAATALRHLPELEAYLKRQRVTSSKADREIAEVAVELFKEMAARLMLRNGVGLKQEELDLGREGDGRPAPAEDPQRALEQAI